MNPPNTYEFFSITSHGWNAMLTACREAKVSIDIEQYIFCDDKIGGEFLNILREKKRDGLKIRILLDTVGSWGFYNSEILDTIKKEGVEVRFFNVISPWRVHTFTSWIFRNHKKTLVVDGLVAFTGGIGIGDYMAEWRDTTVKVEGMAVMEIENSFDEMWHASKDRELGTKARIFRKSFMRRFFITSAPYFKKRFLYYTFIEALRSAKRTIYLTNPYFIPDRRLIRVLRLAVKRGVEVKIIVPEIRDVPIVHTASESTYSMMLKSGVKIFRYQNIFHHGKTVVVDDEWAMAGSFNLDNLSFLYNFEANLVSSEKSFVDGISRHFSMDLENSKEVLLSEWEKRPITHKIQEFFVTFIRDLL